MYSPVDTLHRVASSIPLIEIPHYADTHGGRGPDRETNARDAVERHGMGA